MNKKLILAVVFVCSAVAIIFFLVATPESKVGVSESVVAPTNDIEELKADNIKNPSQNPVAGVVAPAKVITADELKSIRVRSDEIRVKMSALAKDFDKHLEDKEKRKKIEEKYLELTKEYNELAIKLVKADRQLGAAESP